jgi:hypothetical protein
MLTLKMENVMIIEGEFNDEDEYVTWMKNSNKFATLIVRSDLTDFDYKCIRLTEQLADAGKQYGTDYVIARKAG